MRKNLLLSAVLLWSCAMLMAQDQSEIETSITEKLHQRLEGLVPKDLYKLIVHVKAKQERIRVVLEGETQRRSDAREGVISSKDPLPGFKQLEVGGTEEAQVQKDERSRFTYRDRVSMESVDVRFIVDQHLEPQRKEIATKIVTESLDNAYGSLAKLEVVELDLSYQGIPMWQRILQWFSGYLGQRFGSAIDFAYMLALLLILIATVVALVRRFLAYRRQFQTPSKNPEDSSSALANKTIKQQEKFINDVIGAYVEWPLFVRRFLYLLTDQDKSVFLASIKAPALKNYFEDLLAVKSSLRRIADQDFTKGQLERLDVLAADLKRYLEIQKEQVKNFFGFIETIENQALVDTMQQQRDKLSWMQHLAPFLRQDQYSDLTQDWTLDEKVELFKKIHEAKVDDSLLVDIEAKLRRVYEDLQKSSFVKMKHHLQIEKDILETDHDVNEILQALTAQNYDLPSDYQKYRVGFDDLLGLPEAVLKPVLRNISNETLAKALVGQAKMTQRWAMLLGEVRFKLVDSIGNRFTGIKADEIQDARREVLRAYRSSLS
jgi:hypothetical protein